MVGQLPVTREEFNELKNEIELIKTMLGAIKLALESQEVTDNALKAKLHGLLEVEEKKRRLTEDLGNGITIELVEIPAGKFLMGGREITLQPFLMGKYPVTQLQWFAIMGNNPSYFKGDNRPVEQVNWYEANDFCKILSEKTGRTYQLPSEAQWEYACRAGTTTNFFFGDDEKDLDKFAWYVDNSNNETHPVGVKLFNPWGLYDILGNVWECCTDDWEGYSTKKCRRGGCWDSNANTCRSDCRGRIGAAIRNDHLGLRVVVIPGTL